MNSKWIPLLSAALLVLGSHARAQLTRASFDAMFPSAQIENWDSFPVGTQFANGSTVNGVTYNSSAGVAIVEAQFLNPTPPHGLGRTPNDFFFATDTITFSFATPINTFGIDINTFDASFGGYAATTNVGEVFVSVYDPFPGFTTGQFLGFSTPTPFTSITVQSVAGFAFTLDTMRFEASNAPPDCTNAAPNVDVLWPPNHKYVGITINGVTDPDGDPVTITIDSIFQDEALDAPGSGNTSPDGDGVGTSTARVRAERVGKCPATCLTCGGTGTGNGRVYNITFTASDGNGGVCTGTVQVSVPHDQSTPAVDDGPTTDSTG